MCWWKELIKEIRKKEEIVLSKRRIGKKGGGNEKVCKIVLKNKNINRSKRSNRLNEIEIELIKLIEKEKNWIKI